MHKDNFWVEFFDHYWTIAKSCCKLKPLVKSVFIPKILGSVMRPSGFAKWTTLLVSKKEVDEIMEILNEGRR